ncbi:hypothetical protein KC340_g8194 [Hortaea werneckii]|nr:hypothetical protein KC342_g3648 [Hortaea werneckii]KAI7097456.1 hypothetical protein KC339_g9670 [Hortaea werneckii]KAI7212909.1 hypothetical protein KC365_g14454 [Hortaea werneckii]KAI7317919.1 hypothetical protein KC340_g8194 [Hortaea werneckii]KAI7380920.1 hypothetical protein KC328_g12527 [Hortaea werneckii]
MAKSPKEEESRASAVGRKRKQQTAENWRNTNGTASQNKRRKHGNGHAEDSNHEPSDYIPLDAAEPRRSLRLRDRRDSKESGEVSTPTSSSRRTSRESGEIGAGSTSGSSVDLASRPSTTSANSQSASKHGASGTRGTVSTGQNSPRMSLKDIDIPTFRIQLRGDMTKSPGVPIEELIKRYAKDGKDFHKTASKIMRDKKHKFPELRVDANLATQPSSSGPSKELNGRTRRREAKKRLEYIYRDTSNFTRRMSKSDIENASLCAAAEHLLRQQPSASWESVLLQMAHNKGSARKSRALGRVKQALNQLEKFAARFYRGPGSFQVENANDAVTNAVDFTGDDRQDRKEASESETSDDDTDVEDDSSGGDPAGSHYNDYGAFAREAAASDSTDKYDDGIRLYEASEEEQELQHRYFHIEGTAAHVRCLSCGEEGHVVDNCPENTCKHCGAFEDHFSSACPTFVKCGRCRQRGHDSRTCTNQSKPAGGRFDPCDICNDVDHVEEECPKLWRWYEPQENTVVKIPNSAMIKTCYNCGSVSHWGDDCSLLPDFIRDKLHFNRNWSARYASNFIDAEAGNARLGRSAGGGGGQAWQLAALNDMRD